MHERLISHERGRKQPPELMTALTEQGHRSLGWHDAGRIAPGQRADLVAVRLDTVRTAGTLPDQVLLSAYAADVDTVVIDGHVVVSGGRHARIDVAAELAKGEAVVEHAGAINEATLAAIAAAMTKKYGRPVTASAKPNAALLAGLRVSVGDDTYESSIAGQLAALATTV